MTRFYLFFALLLCLTGCFKKENEAWLKLYGTGSATIHWGDGSYDTKTLSPDGYTRFIHKYSNAAHRNITISGENITTIDCTRNELTSLDVSDCIALTGLYCSSNQLTSLNVSNCIALTELYCSSNQLISLNLSGLIALTTLICDGNQLTLLDVSGLIKLTRLYCSYNLLTDLIFNKNTELQWLNCINNQLISLDVSGCTALTALQCRDNQLTSLDMSKNSALEYLLCGYNYMTAVELDYLFGTLNNTDEGKIHIWYNGPDYDSSGTNGCDRSIAENKGWTVVFE